MSDHFDIRGYFPKGRMPRRSSLEVTSDRIADHIERYRDRLSGAEADLLSHARDILERLQEEETR